MPAMTPRRSCVPANHFDFSYRAELPRTIIGLVEVLPGLRCGAIWKKFRAERLLLHSWKHFVDHLDCGGSNEYDENTGEDEKN